MFHNCFKTKLNSEIEFIIKVYLKYPFDILQFSICAKIVQFNKPKFYGHGKCPVCDYLGLVRLAQDLPGKSLKVCNIVIFLLVFHVEILS